MTLASINLRDIFANRPTAGIAGRSFFATDTNSLYRDNGTSWDFIATLTVGGVSVKSSAYTLVATDNLTMVVANSSSAITLTLPASPPSATWNVEISNIGLGTCTIARNGLSIDGVGANLTLTTNQGVSVSTDGANYFTMRGLGSGGGGSLSVTTKGDLQTYSSSAARLGVGADAAVLTADSTQATGLKWAPAPSSLGGITTKTGSYTPLLTDSGKLIVMNSSSATTVTLSPSNASSKWLAEIVNIGTGICTVGTGATVTSSPPFSFGGLSTNRASCTTTGPYGFTGGICVSDFVSSAIGAFTLALSQGTLYGVNLLALKAASGQTPTFIQAKTAVNTSGATLAATFTTNVTAGNAIVVFCFTNWNGFGTNFSVADSQSNSYTTVTNSGVTGAAFVSTNNPGGACTITSTCGGSGTAGGTAMVILEYSGLATASVVDSSSASFNQNGGGCTNTITTTQTGDLILEVIGFFSSTQAMSVNVGLDSGTSLALGQNQGVLVSSDGFNFYSVRGNGIQFVTVPPELTASQSGAALAIAKATQAQNLLYAGPPSGAAAAPTFRAIVPLDLPLTTSVLAANFTATANTTLTNSGLAVTLVAGKQYRYRAMLICTPNATGGSKFALGGTATYTSILTVGTSQNQSTLTTDVAGYATSAPATLGAQAGNTQQLMTLEGTCTVNTGGTMTIQFAQNASNAGPSALLAGSYLSIEQLT